MTHTQAFVAELTTEIEGVRQAFLDGATTFTDRLRADPIIKNGVRLRMLAVIAGCDREADRCQELLAAVHKEWGGGQ